MTTLSEEANQLGMRGYWVAPLKVKSKAPLTEHGIRDSVNTTRAIWDFWQRYPDANIAIDLQRSKLLGIGPDSPEWLDRFREWGLPETMMALSGGGEGHLHYYYQRPEDCPIYRLNRPGEYDIQTDGYFVAPPSLHPSGNLYTWLTPLQYASDLPAPPPWAMKMIKDRVAEKAATAPATPSTTGTATGIVTSECPVRLSGKALDWWDGRRFSAVPGGDIDRSKSLYVIAAFLAQANATEHVISQALAERDITLGYSKYADRGDQSVRYAEIARKAVLLGALQ